MPRSKRVTEETTCVILTGNVEAEPHDPPSAFRLQTAVLGYWRTCLRMGLNIDQAALPSIGVHQCSVISLDTRKAVMGRLSPRALGSFDGFLGLYSACWRSEGDPAIYAGAACRQKNLSCS